MTRSATAAEHALTVRCPRGHRLLYLERTPDGLRAVWHPPRRRPRAKDIRLNPRTLPLSAEHGDYIRDAQCFRCDRSWRFDPDTLAAAVKAGRRTFVLRAK